MTLTLRKSRIQIDLAHAIFIVAIMAYSAWYLHDARANSADFVDLLLVEPVAVGVIIVGAFIFCSTITVRPLVPAVSEVPNRPRLTRLEAFRVFGSMLLVILYVGSLTWLGFDVASFAYVLATLFLLGERRWWILILVPACFCVISIYLFNKILQMPLPLSLDGLFP